MAEFRNEPALLVNTVIAVGLALLISPLSFGLPTTVGGVILLLILYAYDQGTRRTVGQSLAFAAVAALPFTLAIAVGIQRIADRRDLETWLAVIWLCATVIGMAIDRARMSARAAQLPVAPAATATAAPVPPPSPVEVAPQPSWTPRPAPARTASAPKYGLGLSGPAPAPSFQAPPEVVNRSEPPRPEPAPVEPTPVTRPELERTVVSEPQPVTTPPPPPQAQAAEEIAIYINVIDQGISLLRSVRAEHIARDIYRIVDSKPEGEIWRYEPGQTVRCRRQKLSSGKALVAFEEIVLQRAT
jgi:hypothetical protein